MRREHCNDVGPNGNLNENQFLETWEEGGNLCVLLLVGLRPFVLDLLTLINEH